MPLVCSLSRAQPSQNGLSGHLRVKKALTACEPPTKAGAWHNGPSWEQIAHGAQPPSRDDAPKLGAWRHGWQRCASRTPFLLRPRAVAFSASSPPCHASLASWPTHRRLAHGHPNDEVMPQLLWPPLETCKSRLLLPLSLRRVCRDPSHHGCGHFTDDLGLVPRRVRSRGP